MACKLKCPNCKRILKERGDGGKLAQGTYVVFVGEPRRVRCTSCKTEDSVEAFDPWLEVYKT